jgi:hypothetical protein
MSVKSKLWLLFAQIAILWTFTFSLAQFPAVVDFYSNHLYPGIQSSRVILFHFLPFSMGDLLYLAGGVWLLLTLLRWVYYMSKLGAYKDRLVGSMLNLANVALLVYFVFLLGWGANYNKEPLAKIWGLQTPKQKTEKQHRKLDSLSVVNYNAFLVDKLNKTAKNYRTLPTTHLNDRAVAYYREFTNSSVRQSGLGIKRSMYGYFMQRSAVDGYYNPFTGEGQVSGRLPTFMMPFTLCHEMAHQAGVAAEGDANLLAYALSTTVSDPVFQYSAYLNLWLYANNRLRRYDSVVAVRYADELNPFTRAHLDTLEQISIKYHGALTQYTAGIYDSYLRTQNQKEGIRSYGNVLREAWLLELQRRSSGRKPIKIP